MENLQDRVADCKLLSKEEVYCSLTGTEQRFLEEIAFLQKCAKEGQAKGTVVADAEGNVGVNPSRRYLAKKLRRSVSQVSRVSEALQAKGVLRVINRRKLHRKDGTWDNKTNVYFCVRWVKNSISRVMTILFGTPEQRAARKRRKAERRAGWPAPSLYARTEGAWVRPITLEKEKKTNSPSVFSLLKKKWAADDTAAPPLDLSGVKDEAVKGRIEAFLGTLNATFARSSPT